MDTNQSEMVSSVAYSSHPHPTRLTGFMDANYITTDCSVPLADISSIANDILSDRSGRDATYHRIVAALNHQYASGFLFGVQTIGHQLGISQSMLDEVES